MTSLTDKLSAFRESGPSLDRQALHLYFWAVHPILRLTLPNKRRPLQKRLFKLLVTVFGSLAVSALFYASTGTSPHDASAECKGGLPWESWRHMARAMLVAFTSTVLVAGLAKFLTALGGSNGKAQRFIGISFLFVYVASSVMYCILFLANVSLEDGCAWLVTALFRFLMFWLLTPILLTATLAGLERLLVGRQFQMQDDLQAVQFALAGARQVEEAPNATVEINNGQRLAAPTPKGWPRQPQGSKVHPWESVT